jgi:hypothetical protein
MTIRAAAAFALLAAFVFPADGMADEPPQLVLQVTVDQLRGDLPARYYDRLGEGGFRYLLERGVVYRNAHHAHANTETIVGHTTLATGAHPSGHGMVGNLWFDRETGYTTYNVEDERYRLLTAGADVNEDAEIDPTQRAARSEGRSPAAMCVESCRCVGQGPRCDLDGRPYRHGILVFEGLWRVCHQHLLSRQVS